jgi:hypothetical protein
MLTGLLTIVRGLSSERPRQPHTARLRVEPLEPRNVPSVTWTNGDHNNQWNDALNWYDDVSQTNHVPGPSDKAVINFGKPIINDAETVGTLTGPRFDTGTGPIISGSLTVNQSVSIGYLYLQDGATLIGGSGGSGTSAMGGPLTGPPPPTPFSVSLFVIAGNVDVRGRTIIRDSTSTGLPNTGVAGTINISGDVTLATPIAAYINVPGISGTSLTLLGGAGAYGIDNRAGDGTGGGLTIVGPGTIFIRGEILNEMGAKTTITDGGHAGSITGLMTVFDNQGTLIINQSASSGVSIYFMIAGTGDPFTHSTISVNGGGVLLGSGGSTATELLSGAVSVQTGSTLYIESDFTFAALTVTGGGSVQELVGDVVVDSSMGAVSFSNFTLNPSSIMEILPGSTFSINTVGGAFTAHDQSLLIFDIGPSSSTPFGVSGQLVDQFGTVTLPLAGGGPDIEVHLVGGFLPSLHQDFPLITAQAILTPEGIPVIALPPGFIYALTPTNLDALV